MKHKLHFKRFFALLLLLAVSTLSWAYDFEVGGIYYSRNWSYYENGTSVRVTYKTESDRGYSGIVSIPDSVTYEDDRYAVKVIDKRAFDGCTGLKSINIGNCVTSIGYSAFSGCSGLKSINIGNCVTSIDGTAFDGCSGLTSVTIPESVTSIGYSAFSGCSGLTSIVVAEGNTTYDSRNGCNAIIETASNTLIAGCKNTVIPNSVTGIDGMAFGNCSGLTSITIPESVQVINSSAFSGCSNLTDVTINSNAITSLTFCIYYSITDIFGEQVTKYTLGEGVTYIGFEAFKYSRGLVSITIPKSMTSIGKDAFEYCESLAKAEFASIESLCKISFDGGSSNPLCYAKHLYIDGHEVTDLVIPESVTSIGDYAFYNCTDLTSVTIPNSVTSIGLDAFYNCSGLTSVTIPESVQSINESAFQGCSNLTDVTINSNAIVSKNLSYTKSLNNIFGKQVTKYTLGESVTSIGNYTFSRCSKLTSITIPNSVTSIGDLAFQQCTGLTSIIIPNSVTSIGVSAFLGCSGLTSISIPNSVTSIGSSAFRGCSGLTSFTIPESVTSIGNYTFYGCSKLTSITIPNSVTSIGDFAFSGCTSLPVENNLRYADTYLVQAVNKTQGNYTIKSGTRFIGSDAFYDCSRLTSFIVPEGVTSIGAGAFYNCTGLMTINIPNTVTSIGNYTFSRCSKLTSITIPNSVTSIGDYAFQQCTGLTSVTIPNSVTSIGTFAFESCSGLTSVTIPNSVTSIGKYAFDGCSGLTSVTCLAENVPYTGSLAFYNVPQSTATLYVPETSVNAYKTAAQWKEFGNIVGIDPTAVEELKSKKTLKANDNAPIYDLMGRRLQQKPASGYYIQGGKKYYVK